jgi:hypothetical protein
MDVQASGGGGDGHDRHAALYRFRSLAVNPVNQLHGAIVLDAVIR